VAPRTNGRPRAAEQPPGSTRTLLGAHEGGLVKRTVLPSGLRIITESIPDVRSVSFGVWVGVGSRDESPAQAGASHYLEHVLFKGTSSRSALDISSALDAVGGEMNAFTSKEATCFYARVLDTDLPIAVQVIGDMMVDSLVRTSDVDAERNVVLEEIAMRDDDPSDVAHEEFATVVFGDAPLGRPILGTNESIGSISRRTVHSYYRRHYQAPHMVVAVAGNVSHAQVVKLVRASFGPLVDGAHAAPADPRTPGRTKTLRGAAHVTTRDTEQAHIVLGVPGLARGDDRRFTLSVLNAAFGGGMSSRLFQEIRERRGLAYSVYSFPEQYADVGLFSIYAGCHPSKAQDVLALVQSELALVATSGLPAEQIAKAKGQVSGGMVLGLEDTGSRMSRIGKTELLTGDLLSIDEVLSRVHAVTADDVATLAAELMAATPSLAVVGPFDSPRDLGWSADTDAA
jgi:predicted Zn-dependent peptidase